MASAPPLSVKIVIPAYNAAHHMGQVLPAAIAAAGIENVLVIDPGSSDETASVAELHGVKVLRLGRRAGPAEVRNEGAARSDADVVLFVDSDCVPHADVVKRVREAFSVEEGLVSLTGSYDADPPQQNFFSQYMNLRHHYTHQVARREHATFWAGCGAVRRQTLIDMGGFDAEQFPRPEIEDTELGLRLQNYGMTRLDPYLQATHLKRWTLFSVLETDIFRRAIPWARLILERGELPDDLNLRLSQRVAAGVALVVLLSALALLVAPSLALGTTFAVAAVCSVALNAKMLRFFAGQRGLIFAAGAWLFHQFHLVYSASVFVLCSVQHVVVGKKPSRSTL